MIILKTISGHYGSVFNLDHNNRTFIPHNCVDERLYRNYYPVMMGGEVHMDLPDLRFDNEMWTEYQRLVEVYWHDRALVKADEYERLQRELRRLRQYRPYWLLEEGGALGVVVGLLFLPLMIAREIGIERQYDEAIEIWKSFKETQILLDIEFGEKRESVRSALRNYDLRTGTDVLSEMDATVRSMAELAGDIFNASKKIVIPPKTKPKYAILEEIYDKLYEPSFREFQEEQRPCRRYAGTYLEYIREQERKEVQKKAQNKNSRNHKMTEAFEIVIGIGDMDNTGYDAAWSDALKSEALLKDLCNHLLQQKNVCFVTTKELDRPGWQPPFNHGLIVLNLSMHGDEATPGVHLTCVPYSRNCKRGPAVQPSISRAFAGMGYPSTWKDALDENGERIPKKDRNGNIIHNEDGSVRYKKEPDGQGVLDWIEDQKRWIEKEMRKRYGWEREYKGSHPRGNLSTPDYKVARAEERKKEIERHINAMLEDFVEHIGEQVDRLNESVDKVWRDAKEWEMIIRYLNTCSAKEYERLYSRAREHLDYLPMQKKEQAMLALDQMVARAEQKNACQNVTTSQKFSMTNEPKR